jgi:hypothetical protein
MTEPMTEPEPKKLGRPPLPLEMRLVARYNVKVNVDSYNRITRASVNSGVSPEQLIRSAINLYIK